MVTISHIIKKTVDSRPILQDALIEEIVNYVKVAERLMPNVVAEMGKPVKISAVMMALRRYQEELQHKSIIHKPFEINHEIIIKTNLGDVCIVKTPSALNKIKKIHQIVDYEKGDTLNVIQGNYEISIVISQKHLNQLKNILKEEKILNTEKNLVSLTLGLSKDFISTPGVLAFATRKLAWNNINIYENISTMTELIFIISEKDTVKAYNTFNEMIKQHYSPTIT
jgi:aspartokinase